MGCEQRGPPSIEEIGCKGLDGSRVPRRKRKGRPGVVWLPGKLYRPGEGKSERSSDGGIS